MVTLRPGAPDMASSLWIGPIGRRAVAGDRRRSLSRPDAGRWTTRSGSWSTATTWCASIQEAASGQPARIPVDSAAVSHAVPRADHRAAAVPRRHARRDGDRRAGDPGRCRADARAGEYALTYPAAARFRPRQHRWCRCPGAPATTSSSPAPIRQHPVSYVNLDGVNSDGPSRNLLMPVRTVAANPSTVYVADARGVLQLSGCGRRRRPGWVEVRPLMIAGAQPVLPG